MKQILEVKTHKPFMSGTPAPVPAPRILNKKIKFNLKPKINFDKLKGRSEYGNGSLNHLKVMKEEQGFQKIFDRSVFPLCL